MLIWTHACQGWEEMPPGSSVYNVLPRCWTSEPLRTRPTRIVTDTLNHLHLLSSRFVSERTSVYDSRSECLPSPLPAERSILLWLMCRRDSSKPLHLSSLSPALTFTRQWNAGEWLSLGQHVLSLCANAMLRWLYEGPSTRPISFGGAGPCLMRVFYILYI